MSGEEKKTESCPTDTETLWQFATHNSDTYHDFTPKEAAAIREALLTWYRSNRRKLPWRGDAGPFDGSTAGIASGNGKGKKKKTDTKQKDIQSFFTKTSKGIKKDVKSEVKPESFSEEIIPVTGYSVWVSEIMLQQTRVEAVIPFYLKWMKSFPTVTDLANATEEEVNAHWAGLGFYRRARLLHSGAKYVVDELDSKVPETVDELLKISGIGKYTASAISSIAYNKCVPVVDGNVCRVISRLKGVANNIKAPIFKDKIGWRLAEQIVQAGDGLHAGEVNQGLMELGATYCAPSGTGIDENDPLKEFYISTKIGRAACDIVKQTGSLAIDDYVSKAVDVRGKVACALCQPDGIDSVLFQLSDDMQLAKRDGLTNDDASIIGHQAFPTAPPKKAKREEVLGVAALYSSIENGDKKWFMVKRPKDGLLAGQWEFPSALVWSSADDKGKKTKKDLAVPKIDCKTLDEQTRKLLLDIQKNTKDFQFWDESLTLDLVNETPMEHIFSHVRWSMHCHVSDLSDSNPLVSSTYEQTYTNKSNGCECRWMTEREMQGVGITSSVRKVLAMVKKTKTSSNGKKRKRL